MTEAIRSSETSVLTKATWRHMSVDGLLHVKLITRSRDMRFPSPTLCGGNAVAASQAVTPVPDCTTIEQFAHDVFS
jgi:hypothetical protein